ncbi:uncharacterized protein [Palaemon carinicauda]|uniref:uncharacterized protein n=1 Tax=Palaemon carinicauda TaxID=392227 RepID=UPI0035B60ECB
MKGEHNVEPNSAQEKKLNSINNNEGRVNKEITVSGSGSSLSGSKSESVHINSASVSAMDKEVASSVRKRSATITNNGYNNKGGKSKESDSENENGVSGSGSVRAKSNSASASDKVRDHSNVRPNYVKDKNTNRANNSNNNIKQVSKEDRESDIVINNSVNENRETIIEEGIEDIGNVSFEDLFASQEKNRLILRVL